MRFVRTGLILLLSAFALACGNDDGGSAAPDGTISRQQIAVGDLVFEARVAGPEDGELVLLLHGFPETSYEWRAQLEALGRAGYRAVAPDQRGYSPGARPADVADYAIAFMVVDALGIADALGADRFHVVGHDWGAGVAWGLAAFPARVKSLTALSIPHPAAFAAELADPTSCQYRSSAYFEVFSAENAADLFLANDAAILRSFYGGLPADAVAEYLAVVGNQEAMRAALNWYRANITGRMFAGPPVSPTQVPTLFIWSDGDVAICREGAERTADHVDAPYRFVAIAGVNHWVAENAADEVSALLLEHLAQNE